MASKVANVSFASWRELFSKCRFLSCRRWWPAVPQLQDLEVLLSFGNNRTLQTYCDFLVWNCKRPVYPTSLGAWDGSGSPKSSPPKKLIWNRTTPTSPSTIASFIRILSFLGNLEVLVLDLAWCGHFLAPTQPFWEYLRTWTYAMLKWKAFCNSSMKFQTRSFEQTPPNQPFFRGPKRGKTKI